MVSELVQVVRDVAASIEQHAATAIPVLTREITNRSFYQPILLVSVQPF